MINIIQSNVNSFLGPIEISLVIFCNIRKLYQVIHRCRFIICEVMTNNNNYYLNSMNV